MMRFSALILSLATALSVIPSARGALAAGPDFSREVRPILAGHCFKCHGPDDKVREAGLRLDDPKSSTFKLESGDIAIVPGKPADSELVRRINSTDADTQMPPRSANKPLSDQREANPPRLDRRWRGVQNPLGLLAAEAGAAPRCKASRVAEEPDRLFYLGPSGSRKPASFAPRQPLRARSAALC